MITTSESNSSPTGAPRGSGLRVLVLSQHFWPETFRITEVVESLLELGCDVNVLTGQPNYPEGKIFPGYRAAGIGIERHPAGFDICRVPLVPRGRSGALRLVANYLSFIVTASLLGPWLLRGRTIDVIFVYGTSPILQALAGIWLRRVKRCRLVVWVQDLWPESLEATGYVRNRLVLRAVARLVRWIYQHSDLLLVQSEALLPIVTPMAGGVPVAYHPNPGERAFGQATTGTTPPFAFEPGFNVVFAGNLGAAQSLETIVDAADLLRDTPDVRFVLFGSGSRGPWLQQELLRRQLANVVLAGRFPPEAMPAILGRASALLVTLARNDLMNRIVPSKVQAYLAAGRPLIAALDGEGARIVEASGAGVTSPAEDALALAAAVRRLRTLESAALAAMGAAGQDYYRRHFDPATLAHRLTTLLAGPAARETL